MFSTDFFLGNQLETQAHLGQNAAFQSLGIKDRNHTGIKLTLGLGLDPDRGIPGPVLWGQRLWWWWWGLKMAVGI